MGLKMGSYTSYMAAKIGSEPIYVIFAYLTGTMFGDFFDPLVWGHYHLIGFGRR